eukprot:m51a1_g4401 hypothetical protein (148) ;mRNA; f:415835-416417
MTASSSRQYLQALSVLEAKFFWTRTVRAKSEACSLLYARLMETTGTQSYVVEQLQAVVPALEELGLDKSRVEEAIVALREELDPALRLLQRKRWAARGVPGTAWMTLPVQMRALEYLDTVLADARKQIEEASILRRASNNALLSSES